MTVVPTRQPSQSIGGLPMHQGHASDHWLLYVLSPRNACMEPKLTNRASRYFLRNRSESKEVNPWTRNPFFLHKGQCLLEQSVYTMISLTTCCWRCTETRFTVSPFNWPTRMVRFLVSGGVCCVVVLAFDFFTGPISFHSWIFQISSIGCKDCHYPNDASNRPKKWTCGWYSWQIPEMQ